MKPSSYLQQKSYSEVPPARLTDIPLSPLTKLWIATPNETHNQATKPPQDHTIITITRWLNVLWRHHSVWFPGVFVPVITCRGDGSIFSHLHVYFIHQYQFLYNHALKAEIYILQEFFAFWWSTILYSWYYETLLNVGSFTITFSEDVFSKPAFWAGTFLQTLSLLLVLSSAHFRSVFGNDRM